ncbi:MAG: PaaX family transcriptional regulator [Rhodobacteraceae bacterium]|nr:PaaX family transcriptional regulator [Paracoccaceae bacterium]
MTDTSRHHFENIVQELTSSGSSRTWSILVTIFGDLAQNPNDKISGPLLSSLTQLIGIKPQAMRVALHRLRYDGWIITEKSGRTSKHRLSEYGLIQSVIASPKIYARTATPPESWRIIITNPDASVDEKTLVIRGYRKILSGVYIGDRTVLLDTSDFLTLEGDLLSIPEWLQSAIADEASVGEYSRLIGMLVTVERALNDGYAPTITETAVLRTLIVHDWRRIVLRQPDLSLEFLQKNPSAQCRKTVWELLERLERPPLEALEMVAT